MMGRTCVLYSTSTPLASGRWDTRRTHPSLQAAFLHYSWHTWWRWDPSQTPLQGRILEWEPSTFKQDVWMWTVCPVLPSGYQHYLCLVRSEGDLPFLAPRQFSPGLHLCIGLCPSDYFYHRKMIDYSCLHMPEPLGWVAGCCWNRHSTAGVQQCFLVGHWHGFARGVTIYHRPEGSVIKVVLQKML